MARVTDALGDVSTAQTTSFNEELSHSQAPFSFPFKSGFIYFLFSVSIVGMAGNGLVVVVFSKNRDLLHSSAGIFIITQAVLDFLGALNLLVEEGILHNLIPETKSLQTPLTCKVVITGILTWALLHLSTVNLVALTLQRYLQIVHPLSAPAYWSRCTVVSLVAGAMVATAVWDAMLVTTSDVVNGRCVVVGMNPLIGKMYNISHIFLYFALPVTIFCFCYARIFTALRKSHKEVMVFQESAGHRSTAEKAKAYRKEVNLAKTMALVCVAYFLCWGPLNIGFSLYVFVSSITNKINKYYSLMIGITFVNCAINPIVYGYKYKFFKAKVRAMCCGCQNQVETSSTS